jgi:hypothetical protein
MKQRVVALMCAFGAAGAIAGGVRATATPRLVRRQGEVPPPGGGIRLRLQGQKPAPAPRRDISGVWEPAASASAGINATGAQQMPF